MSAALLALLVGGTLLGPHLRPVLSPARLAPHSEALTRCDDVALMAPAAFAFLAPWGFLPPCCCVASLYAYSPPWL